MSSPHLQSAQQLGQQPTNELHQSCHAIDGPYIEIDGLPMVYLLVYLWFTYGLPMFTYGLPIIENGDFPWRTVK